MILTRASDSPSISACCSSGPLARVSLPTERERPHGVGLGDHAPERRTEAAGHRPIEVATDHAANP
jgi:hypothetical protein